MPDNNDIGSLIASVILNIAQAKAAYAELKISHSEYVKEITRQTAALSSLTDLQNAQELASARTKNAKIREMEVEVFLEKVYNSRKLTEAYKADEAIRAKIHADNLAAREAEDDAATARDLARLQERLAAEKAAALAQKEMNSGWVGSGGLNVGAGATTGGITPRIYGGGTGALLGAAAAAGIYESIRLAMNLNDELNKVRIITGATADSLGQLGELAISLAVETGEGAGKIVQAFGAITKAGLGTNDALRLLPEIVKTAVGQSDDLEAVAKHVVTAMNALGIGAGRASQFLSDLVVGSKSAGLQVSELAEILSGKGGIALRTFNVDVKEAIALAAIWSREGVNVSAAQIGLAQVLGRLVTLVRAHGEASYTTNNVQIKYKDLILDTAGNMRTLSSVLTQLDTAFKGQSTKEIDKFFAAIGIGSQRDILVRGLVGVSDQMKALVAAEDQVGAHLTDFSTRTESAQNAWSRFGQVMIGAAANVGDEFLNAAKKVQKFLDVLPKPTGGVDSPLSLFSPLGGGAAAPQNTVSSGAASRQAAERAALAAIPNAGGVPDVDDPEADVKAARLAARYSELSDQLTAFRRKAEEETAGLTVAMSQQLSTLANGVQKLIEAGANPATIEAAISRDRQILDGFIAEIREQKTEQAELNELAKAGLDVRDEQAREYVRQQEALRRESGYTGIGGPGGLTPHQSLGALTASDPTGAITDHLEAMKALGIATDQDGDATAKLVAQFEILARQPLTTLSQLDAGWAKVSATVNKMASTDMPAALAAIDAYIAALKQLGASTGQVMAAEAERLELQVKVDELSGKSANAQIIALEQIRLKQQQLQIQSSLIGNTLVDIINESGKVFDSFSRALADDLVNGKGFAKEWHKALKSIEADFANLLINAALAPLKNALKQLLANVFGGLLGRLGGALGGALGGGPNSNGPIIPIGGLGGGFPGSGSNVTTPPIFQPGLQDIPQFATGIDRVPHDMVAMVHRGERITPAANVGSGRGGVNIHIGRIHSGVTSHELDSFMNRAVKSARRANFEY